MNGSEGEQVTDHPIIFSAEMARAVQSRRKTETRRLVKKSDPYHNWKVGDRLWLRETWGRLDDQVCPGQVRPGHEGHLVFSAEHDTVSAEHDTDREQLRDQRWRSPLLLRKTNARIWMEITHRRIESLREITLTGIVREGWPGSDNPMQAAWWFQELWDRLHGDKPYRFQDNPNVWVIGFRKIEPPAR